ncbi:MAG TPA: asparaginase, partial [Thermoanaerobaculia bacterium]|nr:asparaginase [Thermoanaerobaculia bacterium]
SGDSPSPLHNNCSGKHAGMLLATRLMDASTAQYIAPEHPLQKLIRETVADFAGIEPEDIPLGIDGCGVPAFYVSLYRAAFGYARLMASRESANAPGALSRYAESSSRIVDAMTGQPKYVAGAWSMTTPLMEAFDGALLAKEGAEGFYAMAVSTTLANELAQRLDLADECAIGVAIKIHDGSMTRGRNPVVLKTLELLGIDVASREGLRRYREWPLRNVAGTLVGEVRAEFELNIL